MPKGICYNASRQERRKCSLWHAKSPGGRNSGAFLFRCGLGDKIPQPVVATIVHYLLLIVFVGGIAIGVGFLIFLGASKVFEFYTEDYADTMSLAVFLISLAVSVYFAELIRAVIPINLLLLLILVHIVYVLIRWYVKGCMRSRGYY